MELGIEFDPAEGATHRIRWEVVGPPGDQLSSDAGIATTARFVRGCAIEPGSGWLLTSEVASPISDGLSTDGVVLVFAYLPYDYAGMLEFDRRITERYTEFCASTGEFYAGTVACDAWFPGWLGEVVWYDATTVEGAQSVGAGVELPQDVQAIVDECRAGQNRDRARYRIFFEPLPSAAPAHRPAMAIAGQGCETGDPGASGSPATR